MPGILVYYGDTIRNMPMMPVGNPLWGWKASARWHEEKTLRLAWSMRVSPGTLSMR